MRGKIGIRPLNDGRDSVRYKIEGKCMEMLADVRQTSVKASRLHSIGGGSLLL